jgi:prepilin-type processing-associated H-X9-DG protein
MMMRQKSHRRNGLKLVEGLVILLIGLVVLGLILVWLGRGREQRDRLTCLDHLRRIGEGTLKYGETKKPRPLPASAIADGYGTWAVQIAPYFLKDDENPLKGWDERKPFAQQSAEVRGGQVPYYYCPARRLPGQLSEPSARHPAGALGDYACSSGNGDPAYPWTTAKANGAIILGEVLKKEGDLVLAWRSRTDLGSRARGEEEDDPGSLVRGLSHTILVGEKHVPPDGYGQLAFGDGSLYDGGHAANFARVGGTGHGLARTPDAPFRSNFGSSHPGVCQFLFADGHAEALRNDTSEELLGRLTNRLK